MEDLKSYIAISLICALIHFAEKMARSSDISTSRKGKKLLNWVAGSISTLTVLGVLIATLLFLFGIFKIISTAIS